MRKTGSILLVVMLMIALAACGSGGKAPASSSPSTRRSTSSAATAAQTTESEETKTQENEETPPMTKDAAAEQAQELLAKGKEYEEAALRAAAEVWKTQAVPAEEELILEALGLSPEQYLAVERDWFISDDILPFGLRYSSECVIPGGQLDSGLLNQAEEAYREADALFSSEESRAAIKKVTALQQRTMPLSAVITDGEHTVDLTYGYDTEDNLLMLRMVNAESGNGCALMWARADSMETLSIRIFNADNSLGEEIFSRYIEWDEEGRITRLTFSGSSAYLSYDLSRGLEMWWTYDSNGQIDQVQVQPNGNVGEPYSYGLGWQNGEINVLSSLGSDGSANTTLDVARETKNGETGINLAYGDEKFPLDEVGLNLVEILRKGERITSLTRFDLLLTEADDCPLVKKEYDYRADGSVSRIVTAVNWTLGDWETGDRVETEYNEYGAILTRNWSVGSQYGDRVQVEGVWHYDENGLLSDVELKGSESEVIKIVFDYGLTD